jgi:GYF domain 2
VLPGQITPVPYLGYYIRRNDGQQFGPYTQAQLKQFVAERRIDMSEVAWDLRVNQWVWVWQALGDQPESPATQTTDATPPTVTAVVSGSICGKDQHSWGPSRVETIKDIGGGAIWGKNGQEITQWQVRKCSRCNKKMYNMEGRWEE